MSKKDTKNCKIKDLRTEKTRKTITESPEKVKAAIVFDAYLGYCNIKNIHRIYWRGSYYIYRRGKYVELNRESIEMSITKFMDHDNDFRDHYTRNLMLSVEFLYRSRVEISETQEVNTFITGPKGDMYLSLKNGILDLNAYLEGKPCLLPHTPDFFTLCANPFNFNPEATCPTFHKFINSSQPDEQAQGFLQEWTGYNLTHDTRLETLVLLQGGGKNGKSVYGTILKTVIGFGNFSAVAPEDLDKDSKKLSLLGKKSNICDDMNENKQINFGTLKQTVSGSHVTVDRKYKTSLTFSPTAKHTFIGNQFMNISDRSDGTIRRIIPIHFGVKIADKDKDLRLGRQEFWIESGEIEAIFIWALEGLRRLKNKNWEWTVVDASEKIKSEIKEESQPEIGFFKQCLEITGIPTDRIGNKRLHDIYSNWMGKSKAQLKPQTLVKALLNYSEKVSLSKNATSSKIWEGRQRAIEGVKLIVPEKPFNHSQPNSKSNIMETLNVDALKEKVKELETKRAKDKKEIKDLKGDLSTLDKTLSYLLIKLKEKGIDVDIKTASKL